MREEVVLSRTAEGVLIPSGERVMVPVGANATITQSLGGSYTIITDRGLMVRMSGREVEALGKTPPEVAQTGPIEELTKEQLEEKVWEQLRTCYDPEIPVNIVDLGLVYLCEIESADAGSGFDVNIKMTLTAPGCGMGPVLATDVRGKVEALPGVRGANVDVVFDPVWDRSMMTDAAKLQLGMMW